MPKSSQKAFIVPKQTASLKENENFVAKPLSSAKNIRKEIRNEPVTRNTIRQ
jgi:hypothetical protein